MRVNQDFVSAARTIDPERRILLPYVLVKAPSQRELLNEDVVEKLIRHEAEPSALSGFETTSSFNNFRA